MKKSIRSQSHFSKKIHSRYYYFAVFPHAITITLLAIVLLTALLYEGEPFGLSEVPDGWSKLFKIGGLVLIFMLGLGLALYITPARQVSQAESVKTRSFLFMLGVTGLFTIALGTIYWLYAWLVFQGYSLSVQNWALMMLHTFYFSATVFLFVQLLHIFKDLKKKTPRIFWKLPERIYLNKTELTVKDVSHIEANENYCNVYVTGTLKSERNIVRITFAEISKNFLPYPDFYVVSRSFIVHLPHVTAYTISSGKLQLQIQGQKEAINVSKDKKNDILRYLKRLNINERTGI